MTRIGFTGQLLDEGEIRVGFIGCGSHAFRNIYPTFQFAPVNLVAVCDLDGHKAATFAKKFGAGTYYIDYRQMLAQEQLDAVFVVVGYDDLGRPLYPHLATDCLRAGCHVWIEKPPASSTAEIALLQAVSNETGKIVVAGLKKMFFPANEKAKELSEAEEFGAVSLVNLEYPQTIPTVEEFRAYRAGASRVGRVVDFLDHLCHPASLMVYLLGLPSTLVYQRSARGAGVAVFTFPTGVVASIAFTAGASSNGGMERTLIVGSNGHHILVENNLRVSYCRPLPLPYGSSPSFYVGGAEQAASVWEPEFSLGQLYNKGLFLLGYYNEINEFARAILDQRLPTKGTLEHAWQVTRIFEAFAEGAGKTIPL
jgi:predicted dehydrogenase